MTRRRRDLALKETGATIKTCRAIADVLAADNSRFDRNRFLVAAGALVMGGAP